MGRGARTARTVGRIAAALRTLSRIRRAPRTSLNGPIGSDRPSATASGAATYRRPTSAAPADGIVTLAPADLVGTLHRLTGWAIDHHVALTGLEIQRPSLEDVYLRLTDDAAKQEVRT